MYMYNKSYNCKYMYLNCHSSKTGSLRSILPQGIFDTFDDIALILYSLAKLYMKEIHGAAEFIFQRFKLVYI